MGSEKIYTSGAGLGFQKRHAVVLTLFFVMFISYIDRVNISVAVLAMQESLGWSESMKGVILSAFFFGYMLMQIVGGWLANLFGGKPVIIICLLLCSIFTALTPIAAHLWLPLLIAVRIGLGLVEAPINPAAFNIFSRWVPEVERARSVAFYSSAGFLGTFFALAATGWMVKLYGWEMPFYLFGVVGLVYVLVVNRVVGGAPAESLDDADKTKSVLEIIKKEKIPWLRLFSHTPIWALAVSLFCASWIFYVLLSWLPSYFSGAHGLDVASSGLYSMGPWLIMFLVMNLSGWIADSLVKRNWPITRARKLLSTVGLLGTGVMLIGIQYVANAEQAVVVMCLALGFLALAYASLAPNVLDIAPRYADVLFGMLNTLASVPGVIAVALTGWIVQTTGSYNQALEFSGGIAILGGVIYLIFGTGKKLVD